MPIPIADVTANDLTVVAVLVVLIVGASLIARRMRSGPPGMLSDGAIYRPTQKDYPADFDRTAEVDEGAAGDTADDSTHAEAVDGYYTDAADYGPSDENDQEVVDENASLDDVLRELIANPEKTEFLVLKGVRGYVQFRKLPGQLYGEAVSNANVSPAQKLSDEEHESIVRLGWQDGGSRQNYARYWSDPVDVTAVSRIADDTLRAYGDDPSEATIETA